MKKTFLFILLLISSTQAIFSNSLNNNFETYGDITQILIPASAFFWTIYKKDSDGTLQFSKSIALAQGTTLLLKNSIKEKRPNGDRQSFPSGHTMLAFAGASFLDLRYDTKYKYLFYSAATLTGLSRITSKKHWTHDVIFGAGIGIFSVKIFIQKENTKITYIPLISPNLIAITTKF